MSQFTSNASISHGAHKVSRRQFVATAAASAALLMSLRAHGQVFAADASASQESAQSYKAGTYTASAYGRKGDVTVEVTFDDSSITDIQIVNSYDTPRISAVPFEKIPQEIIENQSLAVDTIAGATFSSNAVITAVEDCVEQAGGDVDALKEVAIPEPQASSKELDADVVVLGAGAAGMGMAMASAMKGAKVVVFEKCANIGGNALVSGGMMQYIEAPDDLRADITDGLKSYFEDTLSTAEDLGFPEDTVQQVRDQFDEYYATGSTKVFDSAEWQAIAAIVSLGVDEYTQDVYDTNYSYFVQTLPMMDWLNEMPLEWKPLVGIAGYPWPDWASPTEGEAGEGYFAAFDEYMQENPLDLTILYSTPADKLIVEDGRVTGAHGTCTDGTEYTVHADKGVVIATGGFSGNQDLLKKYDDGWGFADYNYIPTTNNYGHTGDGLTMAMDAGAAFAQGSPNFMVIPFANAKDWSIESMVGSSGNALLVNLEGKRFVNETLGRNAISKAEMAQTDGKSFLIADQGNSKLIDDHTNQMGLDLDQLIADGKAFKADTLEELAEQIGLDPDTLVATVDQYNEYCKQGSDPDFGRTMFNDESPVDEGPFYASPLTWAVHITCAGLSVNWDNYAILDEDGNDIPGLYGIGEVIPTTGGIMTMANGVALADMMF